MARERRERDVRDGGVADPCLGPVEDVAAVYFARGGLHACWVGAVVWFRQTLRMVVSMRAQVNNP